MEDPRTRLISLVGTVVLHLMVGAWLGATPAQRSRVLRAVEMDYVDLTPEPEEEEPEPEPDVEEAPPEPPPTKEKRVRKRLKQPPPEPEVNEEPPQETPPEKTQEPPAMLDFSEQNLALSGTGSSWAMKTSEGTSVRGVYRRGVIGGSETGSGNQSASTKRPPTRPEFSPVSASHLSREPELIGRLDTMRNYPREAQRQSIEGPVRLLVEIRANGRVRGAQILNDPGGGLGRAAAILIRQARFRPALDRNGRPVDTRIVYTVRYILDD